MSTQQKGFSLVEVLLSLFLVSTVAFFLLQQQSANAAIYSRIKTYGHASNALNLAQEEALIFKSKTANS